MTVQAEINRHGLERVSAASSGADGTAPSRVACQETARVKRQNGSKKMMDVKTANNFTILCRNPHQTAPRRSANNVCRTARLFMISRDATRNHKTDRPPV